MRIGIDVGGTHTDAVILEAGRILASTKALTTPDVKSGVLDALDEVLAGASVSADSIQAVMLGTTQFTNAVIERRDLARVAAIRIGLPSGQGLPPKVGWPEEVARELGEETFLLHGGYLYEGSPLSPPDHREIESLIARLGKLDLGAVAITSAFSPMEPTPEIELARRIQQALPGLRITMSHELGGLGLLERENAALLNSSLLALAENIVDAFRSALQARGLTCPFFLSQNDGTVMSGPFVRRFPAFTFAAGPTNSLRGASMLSDVGDAIVVDIGGTTSDIGVLQGGFPRESTLAVDLGGVRTNFRMPDLLSIGLGGGSLVSETGHEVGPRSVGHALVREARVFGGNTLTATDLAVASGGADVGDAGLLSGLDPGVVARGLETVRSKLDRAVDDMKPSDRSLPVILVGGGALLVTGELDCAPRLIRPPHADVANAVGAAIAQVGGEAERIVSYRAAPREQAIAEVKARAVDVAVKAGALRETVSIVDIDETDLAYMEPGTKRLRIRAVGEISLPGETGSGSEGKS